MILQVGRSHESPKRKRRMKMSFKKLHHPKKVGGKIG